MSDGDAPLYKRVLDISEFLKARGKFSRQFLDPSVFNVAQPFELLFEQGLFSEDFISGGGKRSVKFKSYSTHCFKEVWCIESIYLLATHIRIDNARFLLNILENAVYISRFTPVSTRSLNLRPSKILFNVG